MPFWRQIYFTSYCSQIDTMKLIQDCQNVTCPFCVNHHVNVRLNTFNWSIRSNIDIFLVMEFFLLDQFLQSKMFSHQNQMTENFQSSISGCSISTINPMTKFKPLFNHRKNLAIKCCLVTIRFLWPNIVLVNIGFKTNKWRKYRLP